MNAIHAAFRAVNDLQASKGRTAWVQLGWLYLDTIAILKKFTASKEDYIHVQDVMDLAALERLFAERGAADRGTRRRGADQPPRPDARRRGARRALPPPLGQARPRPLARLGLQRRLPAARRPRRDEPHEVHRQRGRRHRGPGRRQPGGPRRGFPAPPGRDRRRAALPAGTSRGSRRRSGTRARSSGGSRRARPRWPPSSPRTPPSARCTGRSSPPPAKITSGSRGRPGATGGMISFTLRGKLDGFYDRLRLPKGPELRHADDAHLPLHVPRPLRPGDDAGRAAPSSRPTASTRTSCASASERSPPTRSSPPSAEALGRLNAGQAQARRVAAA